MVVEGTPRARPESLAKGYITPRIEELPLDKGSGAATVGCAVRSPSLRSQRVGRASGVDGFMDLKQKTVGSNLPHPAFISSSV